MSDLTSRGSRRRRAPRAVLALVDLGPVKRRSPVRGLLLGLLARQLGFQLTATALVYEVYARTRSVGEVGFLSLVQLASSLAASVFGGAIVDAVDRRTLLRSLSAAIPACSVGLALVSMPARSSVGALLGLAGLNAGLNSLETPTRMAAMMSVVSSAERVPTTILRQFAQQLARLLAPFVAGLLIALEDGSTAAVYWLDVGCSLVAFLAILRLAPLGVDNAARAGVSALLGGLRYALASPPIVGCLAMDLSGTVLGSPSALLPVVAFDRLHGGGITYGILAASTGAGGVLGSLLSGWTRRARRLGMLITGSICVWGAAIALFGLASSLVAAVAALVAAGWSDVVSAALRNAVIHAEVPDALRGRVAALQAAAVQAGPRLGNAEGAYVASAVSPEFAIVSGGIAAIAGTLALARLLPSFRRYVHATVPQTSA